MFRFNLITGVGALLLFVWAQVQGVSPFTDSVSASSPRSSGSAGRLSHK